MRYRPGMRTTLDIDDDVMRAADELAARHGTTAGKVLSDLARQLLEGHGSSRARHGVPLLPPQEAERAVSIEDVERLLREA